MQPTTDITEVNQYISGKCKNQSYQSFIQEVEQVVDSFCERIKFLLNSPVVNITSLTSKMLQFHTTMLATLRTFDRYMELRGYDSYTLRLLATKLNTTITPYKVQLAKQIVETQESFQTIEAFCGILNKYEYVVISDTHEDVQLFQMLLLQATRQELNTIANKIKPVSGVTDRICYILGNLKTFCSTCKIDTYIFGGLRGILYQQITNDKQYFYAITQDLQDQIYLAVMENDLNGHINKIKQIVSLSLSLQLPIYAYIHDLQNKMYMIVSKYLSQGKRPRLFLLLHKFRNIRDILSIFSYQFNKLTIEAIYNYFDDHGGKPDQLAIIELIEHYQLQQGNDDLDAIQLFDLIGQENQYFLCGTAIFNYLVHHTPQIKQNTKHFIDLIKSYYILDVADFLTEIIKNYESKGKLFIDKGELNYSGLELGQVIYDNKLLLGTCEMRINGIKVIIQPLYAQLLIDKGKLSNDQLADKYDSQIIRQLEITLQSWNNKPGIINILPIYAQQTKNKHTKTQQNIHTVVCQLARLLKLNKMIAKSEILQIAQNDEMAQMAVQQLVDAGVAEIVNGTDLAYQ